MISIHLLPTDTIVTNHTQIPANKKNLMDEIRPFQTEIKNARFGSRLLVYGKLVSDSFDCDNLNGLIFFQIVTELRDVDIQVARIKKRVIAPKFQEDFLP